MDEFIAEFEKSKRQQSDKIEEMFKEQKREIKEVLDEIKDELKKINEVNDKVIELRVRHELLEKDVQALAANYRLHSDKSENETALINKMKWDINLVRGLGAYAAVIASGIAIAVITKKLGF
jgi:DNA repair exonuclease SbcCD ATPase subunit